MQLPTVLVALISMANTMDIVVPAYFYPENKGLTYWNKMTATAKSGVQLTVIINPNSGPGKSVDKTYLKVSKNVRNAGAKTIGYVSTVYGKRNLSLIYEDIDKYVSFYPVDGFFFDEMSDDTSTVAYYKAIYNYVKAKKSSFTVMNNPGTTIPKVFATTPVADRFVVFESNQKAYGKYKPLQWQSSYPASTFVHIIYNTKASEWKADLNFAASNNTGGIYITNDKGANPYDSLPSYWNNFAKAVGKI